MTDKTLSRLLSLLPSVDRIINRKEVLEIPLDTIYKVQIARNSVGQLRKELIKRGIPETDKQSIEDRIVQQICNELKKYTTSGLRRVINATGIILHTNLGRAPFPPAAESSWQVATQYYCNLEIDLKEGRRGDRIAHVEDLLKLLTGAESAIVVNNNAAAVLVTLNTLASGKEVVVSRGQLIEIGGGFRIPEVMERSGAVMCEVGTTNKTRIADYQKAIHKNTAVLLAVHTSNYRVVGFTEEAGLTDLVDLGKKKKIPVIYDLGGGILVDLKKYGLPSEPVVSDCIRAGVDVAMFSGDKIIGGPQCGILVGKKKYIDRIRKNHLLRALRCDKMTYAILEATLKLFLNEKELLSKHPVLRMLTESQEIVKARAEKLQQKLGSFKPVNCRFLPSHAQTGSGALPLEQIESWAVVIDATDLSAEKLSARLRETSLPVIGYVKENKLYLDMRTVLDNEVELIYQQFHQVFSS